MNRDTENLWREAAKCEKKLAEYWEAHYAAEKERADRLEKAIKEALEWTWGCGPQNVGEIESILRKAIVGKE